MKRLLLSLLLGATAQHAFAFSKAGNVYTTNGSHTDVAAAFADGALTAGDIIDIPAGSFSWTGQVVGSPPANVTLRGAGTSATGGGDVTTITDNYASSASVFVLTVPATGTCRVTGITFKDSSEGTKTNGIFRFEGSGNLRIDHCRFVGELSSGEKITVQFGAGVFGVMDDCIGDFTDLRGMYFKNGRNGGGSNGDYEWSLATGFGSADFFFLEDNVFNGYSTGASWSARILDGYDAARVVVRFNDLNKICLWEQHPVGHSGNGRGPRAMEGYGNLCTTDGSKEPNSAGCDMQSGTGLIWGNSWNLVYKSVYKFRVTRSGPDVGGYSQSATPTGWGYAGNYYNGTGSNWDGGTYNGTDLVGGYPCLDQPGRGQGDLLSGDHPSKVNSVFGVIRWPRQALEPIYVWNNTGSYVSGWGGAQYNTDAARIVSDRDYYEQASAIQTTSSSPFNGTTGTGWGTLANRPTTCTTGVAYFATDQGSWNQSTSNTYGVDQSGADGVLYVATATNTWTAYYTPYTYPHPLRSVSSENPRYTPRNARGVNSRRR